ncbi:MAG: restriction endonuclease subunit S [Anaerolineae bacterium]|nr:restriction endonuclease subunit S [Anaerolineae bacterium]
MIGEQPLPEGWRRVKMGEVCASTEKRDPRDAPDLIFRYVDISSIDNRLKRIVETRTILGKYAPSRARQIMKANDVLIATTRPNLNAVVLVPKELHDEICSTGFCVSRPTEPIEPSFLFAFVQSQYFIDMISGQVRGMLYPAVTDNQIRNVYLPLPPLAEQRRIAARVQELMQEVERARAACKRQLEAVKALPAAYLREAFESEEAKRWEKKRLGEVCRFTSGKFIQKERVKSQGVYPVYGANGIIGFTDEKIFEKEVIVIGRVGSCGTVNKTFGPAWITDNTIILQPLSQISFDFLYLALKSLKLEDFQAASVQPLITQGDLKPLLVPLLPLSVQNCIAADLKEKMTQAESLCASIEKQLEAINALPQAILRKAFRGEL